MDQKLVQILSTVGVLPKDKSLYKVAFTHRSVLNEAKEKINSNERLEFLGDAVLSFIISQLLYRRRPTDSEGGLTNLRSYIVKTDSLAKVAKQLELGGFLKLSRGEEMSGGQENTQLLANTYEALLGAVYLDLGILEANKFVSNTLLPEFEKEIVKGPPKDAKSQLQEIVQNLTKLAPKYRILETFGPDHAKKFKVGVFIQGEMIGEGFGSSKQQAEEEAANQGLTTLNKKYS